MSRREQVYLWCCVPRGDTAIMRGFTSGNSRSDVLDDIYANFGECDTIMITKAPYMEAETDAHGWTTYRRKGDCVKCSEA